RGRGGAAARRPAHLGSAPDRSRGELGSRRVPLRGPGRGGLPSPRHPDAPGMGRSPDGQEDGPAGPLEPARRPAPSPLKSPLEPFRTTGSVYSKCKGAVSPGSGRAPTFFFEGAMDVEALLRPGGEAGGAGRGREGGGCGPEPHRGGFRGAVETPGPGRLRAKPLRARGEFAGPGATASPPATLRAKRGNEGEGEDGGAHRRREGVRGRAGLGRRGGDRARHRRRRVARPLRERRLGADRVRVGCRQEQTMNPDMIAALRELEREKGIAFQTILAGLEEAMASAYKSWWKQQHPDLEDESFGVRASIDPESGDLRVWIQELAETREGEPAGGAAGGAAGP